MDINPDHLRELLAKMEPEWTRLNQKDHLNRWVMGRSKMKINGHFVPCRQKTSKRSTKIDTLMYDEEEQRWYLRGDEGGEKIPIVTTDNVCNVIATEYLRRGSIEKTKKTLLGHFAGIVPRDLESLLRVGTQGLPLRQSLGGGGQSSSLLEGEQSLGNGGQSSSVPGVENVGDQADEPRPTPSISEGTTMPSRPLAVVSSAYMQQQVLFEDPRRLELEKIWKEKVETNDNSYWAYAGEIALHIYEGGRAARPYTEGKAHGVTEWSYDEADYLLFTEDEYFEWLQKNLPPRPVVVRDAAARRQRAMASTEDFLDDLGIMAESLVDVQHWDPVTGGMTTTQKRGRELKETWHTVTGSPLNLLNLGDHSLHQFPNAIAATPACGFLQKLCGLTNDAIYYSLPRGHREEPGSRGPGKKPIECYAPTDIKNCAQLRIAAQAGAVSSWHADMLGPFTVVTVLRHRRHGTPEAEQEKDVDILKHWPIFPLDQLDEAERLASLDEFKRLGTAWRPTPTQGIPVISLIGGDTIVVPPRMIHAPVTITNVSMAGGMFFDERHLLSHLRSWLFLTENNDKCTNEPPPKQTKAILTLARQFVLADPIRYGIRPDQVDEFNDLCNKIIELTYSCDCPGKCRKSCECVRYEVSCGPLCHPTHPRCPNARRVP